MFNSPPGAPPTSARNIAPSGPRNIKRGNRGSALLNNPSSAIPTCASCGQLVRGPFISAVGKIWCPNHFVCAHPSCGMSLHDVGFVEENGRLYCERDFANFLAPKCNKCFNPIMAVSTNSQLNSPTYHHSPLIDPFFFKGMFLCVGENLSSGMFRMRSVVSVITSHNLGLFNQNKSSFIKT